MKTNFTTGYRYLSTAVMTAAFGFFGIAKIVKLDVVTGSGGWDRISEGGWAAIGLVELAAVAGLVLALATRFRRVGIAAATGLAALTLSAVVYHLVNSDPAGDTAPAVVQFFVSSGYVLAARKSLSTSVSAPVAVGAHPSLVAA